MGSDTSKPSSDIGSSYVPSTGSQYSSYEPSQHSKQSNPSIQSITRIDRHIQQKITKGVSYNLKIVIRGKRGSGKTMLFRRLKGLGFLSQYIPTSEIQTATINWSHNKDDSQETVKVEVWDVVDMGISISGTNNSIGSNGIGVNAAIINEQMKKGPISTGTYRVSVLDATMVDVYQDTSAVIFVVNPFDTESLEYVRKAYDKVPYEMPILILHNFRDKFVSEDTSNNETKDPVPSNSSSTTTNTTNSSITDYGEATVSASLQLIHNLVDEIRQYRKEWRNKICFEPWSVEQNNTDSTDMTEDINTNNNNSHSSTRRQTSGSSMAYQTYYSLPSSLTEDVHCIEVSMLNCYGLQELYRYISIPFLRLKQRVLEEQLFRGRQQLDDAEASLLQFVSGNTYAAYVIKYEQIQRERKLREQQAHMKDVSVTSSIPQDMSAMIEGDTSDEENHDLPHSTSKLSSKSTDGLEKTSNKVTVPSMNKSKNASIMKSVNSSDDEDKRNVMNPVPLRVRRKNNPSMNKGSSPISSNTTNKQLSDDLKSQSSDTESNSTVTDKKTSNSSNNLSETLNQQNNNSSNQQQTNSIQNYTATISKNDEDFFNDDQSNDDNDEKDHINDKNNKSVFNKGKKTMISDQKSLNKMEMKTGKNNNDDENKTSIKSVQESSNERAKSSSLRKVAKKLTTLSDTKDLISKPLVESKEIIHSVMENSVILSTSQSTEKRKNGNVDEDVDKDEDKVNEDSVNVTDPIISQPEEKPVKEEQQELLSNAVSMKSTIEKSVNDDDLERTGSNMSLGGMLSNDSEDTAIYSSPRTRSKLSIDTGDGDDILSRYSSNYHMYNEDGTLNDSPRLQSTSDDFVPLTSPLQTTRIFRNNNNNSNSSSTASPNRPSNRSSNRSSPGQFDLSGSDITMLNRPNRSRPGSRVTSPNKKPLSSLDSSLLKGVDSIKSDSDPNMVSTSEIDVPKSSSPLKAMIPLPLSSSTTTVETSKTQPRRKRLGGIASTSRKGMDISDSSSDEENTKLDTIHAKKSFQRNIINIEKKKEQLKEDDDEDLFLGTVKDMKTGDLDDSFFKDDSLIKPSIKPTSEQDNESDISDLVIEAIPRVILSDEDEEEQDGIVRTNLRIQVKNTSNIVDNSSTTKTAISSTTSVASMASTSSTQSSPASTGLSREAQLAIQAAMASWNDTTDDSNITSKKTSKKKSKDTKESKDASSGNGNSTSSSKRKSKKKPTNTIEYDYDSETEF